MGKQIKHDVPIGDIQKGDYAFIRIAKGDIEDIGLLYFFDDDNCPTYLTHNHDCGGALYKRYADKYGYRFAVGIRQCLYFHTTHLLDTLKVSIKLKAPIGEPREAEILNDMPSNISEQMKKIIGLK